MGIYALFTTDRDLETEGIYLEYAGARFLVARAGGGNKKFTTIAQKRLAPFTEAMRRGVVDEETSVKVLAEIYADSVILDWENVTDKNDNPLPYNRENVIKVLTELPELFDVIRVESENVKNFRPLVSEEDLAALGND